MRRVLLHIMARFHEAMAARALRQHDEHIEKSEKLFRKIGR
jgi:hypothetical protein